MGFAVLHIEKGGAGSCTGLGTHIDRKKHVLNADPALTPSNFFVDSSRHFNRDWSAKNNLQDRIKNRIREGYSGKTAIRKDAVTHLNIILTGSHDEMKVIAKDQTTLTQWALQNYDFMVERFGKDNIVDFSIHMDERTPHIHCVVVPLTPDGRLSAKKVMGDRRKLSELQDAYGKAMDQFGLKRGLKGSTATHDSVREFYARINDVVLFPNNVFRHPGSIISGLELPKIPTPPLTNREKWAETQNKTISATFAKLKENYEELSQNYQQQIRNVYATKVAKEVEMARSLRSENCQLKGFLKHSSNKENVL